MSAMRFRTVMWGVLVSTGFCLITGKAYGDPADLFASRISAGEIRFVGIDPAQPGNPNANPSALAQVSDLDGTLGRISAASPPFLRYFGKGLVIVGGTITGTIGGAGVGAAAGLGIASIPGAVVGAVGGGVGGLLTSVGGAILANTSPPAPQPPVVPAANPANLVPPLPPPPPPGQQVNPTQTQDVSFFDRIIVHTGTGNLDLASAMITGVLNDPATTSRLLPGGGQLFVPGASLFAGSNILDTLGNPLLNGEVQIAILDNDHNPATTSDRSVVVLFQDLTRGIRSTDRVNIFLDNVVSPTLFSDGDRIDSRQIFAVTMVPEPSTWLLFSSGLAFFIILRKLKQRES